VIDTHAHLHASDDSPEHLVERARAAGVHRILEVGASPNGWDEVVRFCDETTGVFPILGIHPHDAGGADPVDLERLRELQPVAIGETGLDYYRDRAPRDDQRRAFEGQIDLARRLELPLVIHTRAAEEDTFAMLRDRAEGLTVILHCFSAPGRLDECVERGYMCSFAGNVTYPKATGLRAAVRDVPDRLLLLETDSPYLAPQPVRGKPNEPANVIATAAHVAELRGVEYGDLEAAVERNAARVFGW
jgi:TatD DNase family protein